MDSISKKFLKIKYLVPAVLVVVVLFSIAGYLYYQLSVRYNTETSLLKDRISSLTAELANSTKNQTELSGALNSEQSKNTAFTAEIQQIQGTVGTLVKLSKTDPELLKKYSKVYFLNENYVPAKLTAIDSAYLSDQKRQLLINAEVWPFMQRMLEGAKKDGLTIQVASAYRSFGEQSTLKSNYKFTYGFGANTFSADQGYSEHQLGTTADLTTPQIGGVLLGFDKTDAFKWMNENAYKYGFVISYPQGNKYYMFEPWHWRFVGISLATTLHDNGKYFYDMEQRAIDPYLITLFDEQ